MCVSVCFIHTNNALYIYKYIELYQYVFLLPSFFFADSSEYKQVLESAALEQVDPHFGNNQRTVRLWSMLWHRQHKVILSLSNGFQTVTLMFNFCMRYAQLRVAIPDCFIFGNGRFLSWLRNSTTERGKVSYSSTLFLLPSISINVARFYIIY